MSEEKWVMPTWLREVLQGIYSKKELDEHAFDAEAILLTILRAACLLITEGERQQQENNIVDIGQELTRRSKEIAHLRAENVPPSSELLEAVQDAKNLLGEQGQHREAAAVQMLEDLCNAPDAILRAGVEKVRDEAAREAQEWPNADELLDGAGKVHIAGVRLIHRHYRELLTALLDSTDSEFNPDYKDDPETLRGVIRDLTEAYGNVEKDRAALLDEVRVLRAECVGGETICDMGAQIWIVADLTRILAKHDTPEAQESGPEADNDTGDGNEVPKNNS